MIVLNGSEFPYRVMVPMAPVAVIFACCATPSPKFRVEKAVSPSGIIHAARSGTRFRHFNATMLAAISLLCHALTEVSGREGGVAFRYHPCRKVGYEVQAFQFTLPASDATINYHVKKLVKAAGVEKKVSFHCSRHTFATMMLTLGVDIYTTSKLLGHANVTTTAIYAKIVDKKKVDAMNLVNDLFTKDDNTGNYEDRTTQPQA